MFKSDPFVVRDANGKIAGVYEDAKLFADIRALDFLAFCRRKGTISQSDVWFIQEGKKFFSAGSHG